jgi:hypothetical protein
LALKPEQASRPRNDLASSRGTASAGHYLGFSNFRFATVPEALIREFSDRAYSEVRRREREASSNEIAKDRGRVALAVASRTGRRVGLDTASRMGDGRRPLARTRPD